MTDLQEVTFTELIQRPVDTVAKLKQSPRHALRLHRRGAEEDLVLVAAGRAAQEEQIVEVAVRLLRAVMNDPATRSHYLLDLLPAVFPWVRFLPEADRIEFAQELVDVMEAGVEIDSYTAVLTAIEQWRHSAEVYADPELFQALRDARLDDAGPVPAPTA
jgi:hypothetical protein